MDKLIPLVEALNSKLFHDIAGVVGSIDNCLDLIDNDNNLIKKQAKDLAINQSERLTNYVKLYSTIFGLGDPEADFLLQDIRVLLKDFFSKKNLSASIKIYYDEQVEPKNIKSFYAKIVMGISMILSDNMQKGQNNILEIYLKDNINKPVSIIAKSSKFLLNTNNNLVFSDATTPVLVKNSREHYINYLCSKLNYVISVDVSDTLIQYDILSSLKEHDKIQKRK